MQVHKLCQRYNTSSDISNLDHNLTKTLLQGLLQRIFSSVSVIDVFAYVHVYTCIHIHLIDIMFRGTFVVVFVGDSAGVL